MMSIAKQRISKNASLRIEDVFSAWSVQSGYKEVFSSTENNRVESSFETPACRDMSLGAEELSWQLQKNGKKGIRRCKKDVMCAAVTVRLL
jgi:fructosamine-3-kinase